jgi:hypothetical protein
MNILERKLGIIRLEGGQIYLGDRGRKIFVLLMGLYVVLICVGGVVIYYASCSPLSEY